MNVLFSTETPLPLRLTPERESEPAGVSGYVIGVVLLCVLVALPALMNVLASMAAV
ncbi:MAG: hypothetical protein WAU52_16435 [Burkholderiales bacterium]